MKIKSNKGYVAIDASIAVLILLIIVPTIVGMIYNTNKTNNLIDRKTEAISIAVNTIEATKGIGLDGIIAEGFDGTTIVDSLLIIYPNLIDKKNTTGNVNTIMNIEGLTLTKDENTYKIDIKIEDYANTVTDPEVVGGKVKIVTVTVEFRSGKQEKNIELSTVIS